MTRNHHTMLVVEVVGRGWVGEVIKWVGGLVLGEAGHEKHS